MIGMTDHTVVAGYVTVETAVPGGRAQIDIPRGASLPDDVPAEQREALLQQGRVAPSEAPEAELPERPPQSASKAKWVAWAVQNDMPAEDADKLTKAELIERFGQDNEPADENPEE